MAAKDATPSGGSPDSGSIENVTAKGFASAVPVGEQDRSRKQEDAAFDTTEDVRHYKPIDSYEGIHRWDPDFEWEEEEEKKIVKKVPIDRCGKKKSLKRNRYMLTLSD